MLLAEAAVRMRESSLPLPPTWFGPEMPIKDRQIRDLERAGGASVITVGSSVVDVSFTPGAMTSTTGLRPVYNAATGAGSLRMIDIWTRLLAVPRLHPDVVVFGLVSRELNDNDPAQAKSEQEFFEAPAVKELLGTEDAMDKAERKLSEVSALFRYRKIIRDPDNFLSALGLEKVQTGRTYGDIISPGGQYEGFLDRSFTYTPAVDEQIRNGALRAFEIGTVQLQTLRTMLDYLHEHVAHVIVVNMPVTTEYIGEHPAGRADYDRYVNVLTQEVGRAGAAYVDGGVWPETLFADPAHLNRAGSQQLTALVDREVAKALAR